jgi:hypothetical protein
MELGGLTSRSWRGGRRPLRPEREQCCLPAERRMWQGPTRCSLERSCSATEPCAEFKWIDQERVLENVVEEEVKGSNGLDEIPYYTLRGCCEGK